MHSSARHTTQNNVFEICVVDCGICSTLPATQIGVFPKNVACGNIGTAGNSIKKDGRSPKPPRPLFCPRNEVFPCHARICPRCQKPLPGANFASQRCVEGLGRKSSVPAAHPLKNLSPQHIRAEPRLNRRTKTSRAHQSPARGFLSWGLSVPEALSEALGLFPLFLSPRPLPSSSGGWAGRSGRPRRRSGRCRRPAGSRRRCSG